MTEKKLSRYVTVAGATYGPDDDIPADVAKQIDNPKAFEEPDTATPADVVARKQSGLDSDPKSQNKSGK